MRHSGLYTYNLPPIITDGPLAEAKKAGAWTPIDHLDKLLTTAPAGPAGWIIPIDPMLAPLREHPRKQALFAKLAARAA